MVDVNFLGNRNMAAKDEKFYLAVVQHSNYIQFGIRYVEWGVLYNIRGADVLALYRIAVSVLW